MKLEGHELTIARLTLAIAESRVLDLVRHDDFPALLDALSNGRTAPGVIAQLVRTAMDLARVELGLPPALDADSPRVQ